MTQGQVVGPGVIKVAADTTELKSGIDDAKKSARALGAEFGNSAQAGATKAQKAIDAYVAKLTQAAQNVGKTSSEIKLFDLAQRGATESQLAAAKAALATIDAHRQQQAELRKAGAASTALGAAQQALAGNTKLSAYQAQQLSFQLNDLFVQIASGQSPITALIQQGSQLSGTFGGIKGTLAALASVFTPVRVAIGGVVGALATFGTLAYQGSEQSRDFANALTLTGNAAGITEGQFNALYKRIADETGTTFGQARETLLELVKTGQFSGDALTETAKAVQLLGKATGEATSDVLQKFVTVARDVGKGAEDLNRQYRFLSASQLQDIKNMAEQGDSQRALALTLQALNGRVEVAAKNVSDLGGYWDRAKRAVSGYIDAAKELGRAPTAEQQLADARQNLKNLQDAKANKAIPLPGVAFQAFRDGSFDPQIKAAQELVSSLEAVEAKTQGAALASAKQAATEQARVQFNKRIAESLTDQQKLAKELAIANKEADAAGASPQERAAVLDGIRRRYAKLDTDANALEKSRLESSVDDIRRGLNKKLDAYRNANTVFEALRQAGAVSDAQYYEQQRVNLDLQEAADVRALEAEKRLLQQRRFAGKDALKDSIDNARRIADLDAEILRTKEANAAEARKIDIQEEAARRRRIADIVAESVAQQQALEASRRAYALDLALGSKSDAERSRLAARAQIEDKYRQDKERADAEIATRRAAGQATADEEAAYAERLRLIQTFKDKALSEFDDYYAQRPKQDADSSIGVSRAFQNYIDAAANAAKQTEDLLTRAFSNTEDALVKFVQTGKLDFKSLADSIIADLIRIQVRAAIARAVSSAQGGGSFLDILSAFANIASGGYSYNGGVGTTNAAGISGGRAAGGPVEAGKTYWVGEKGPELLRMGAQSGSITPNHAIGGGVTIINQTTGRIDRVQESTGPRGEKVLTLEEVAASIYDPNSRVSRALKSQIKAERIR